MHDELSNITQKVIRVDQLNPLVQEYKHIKKKKDRNVVLHSMPEWLEN